MIRVLHIVPHVHGGGADLCAIDMVRALNNRTSVTARLCVFQGSQVPAGRLKGLKDPVMLNFAGSHWDLSQYIKFRRNLRALVAEWKPDVIHSHLWPACRWASTALEDIDVKHVWHIHDTREWLQAQTLRDRLFRAWTRRLATRLNPLLLSVSCAAAAYTARNLGLCVARIKCIPCAVDTKRFCPQPRPVHDVPVIGVAAQFRPEKGHDIFLRALRQLADCGDCPIVLLAGDGQTLEASKRLSRTLELKNVEFLGHVTDMPSFLSQIDLLVLPSTRFEGLPLSILEAMCAGVPVVATDVAGTGELVISGETGLLVSPNDSSALANAIQCAIHDLDAMTSFAARARRFVTESYSTEAIMLRLEQHYRHHLGLHVEDSFGKTV